MTNPPLRLACSWPKMRRFMRSGSEFSTNGNSSEKQRQFPRHVWHFRDPQCADSSIRVRISRQLIIPPPRMAFLSQRGPIYQFGVELPGKWNCVRNVTTNLLLRLACFWSDLRRLVAARLDLSATENSSKKIHPWTFFNNMILPYPFYCNTFVSNRI